MKRKFYDLIRVNQKSSVNGNKSNTWRSLVGLVAGVLCAPFAFGQFTFGTDNAGNYGSNWTGNQGTGFDAWTLTASPAGGFAGRFIGNPSGGGITGMNTNSFGLFANPNNAGNESKARRTFSGGALQFGDVFSFQMGLNWDAGNNDGFKGIDLRNSSGTVILNFNMGNSETITWSRPGAGTGGNLFTDYGTQAMNFEITRTGTNQYRVVATPRDVTKPNFDEVITLAGEIAGFEFYAGRLNNDFGNNRQPYYNNLSITNSGVFDLASGTETYSRALTGSSNVSKLGNGTLVFTGANTYTGSTTINGGTLELNRSGGATLAATNNVTVDGGTLRVRSNQTLNNLTITSGTLIVDAGVTLTINGTFISTGGEIENNGSIALSGTTDFPGNESIITAMNNVIINSAGGVELDQPLTIEGNLTLTNGLLTLGDFDLALNGSLLGGSASSYINTSGIGFFQPRVAATGANTFHVGAAGVYAPLTLDFTAAVFGSDPRLLINTGSGMPSELHSSNTNFVNRTWTVEPQDITDFTYTIEFSYDASEITSGTVEADLIPAKVSNDEWYMPIGASFTTGTQQGTASINTTTNTITWSGLTTFSRFINLQNISNPLPVKLTAFNGNCNANEIVLSWTTASEENASHFDVQMSRDGMIWNNIGRVEAAGTTSHTSNYQFSTNNSGALTYFRLVQIDFDGASEIYGPISSVCDINKNTLVVAPNPASETFKLEIRSTEAVENAIIQIVDMMGTVVWEQASAIQQGSNNLMMQANRLSAGTYIIRVQSDNSHFESTRIMIK